jgi:hypothetical protein
MSNVQGTFRRGTTYNMGTTSTLTSSYGTSVNLEGHIGYFKDETVSSGGIKTLRSDRTQKCMIVRNVSGIALLPKRIARWASGYVGRRVDGYTAVDNQWAAGVVDERLPAAGVPNYDLFWLQVAGPCLVNMPLSQNADIAEGDQLVAITAATSQATTAGRPQKLVATSNATTALTQALNKLGRALSAKSSSQTTADILVDLELMNQV